MEPISLRVGPVLVTTEGVLLASAFVVFAFAAYRRLRGSRPTLLPGPAVFVIAVSSTLGIVGAAVYGIPGTMTALRADDALPVYAAVAFGSFGGVWGVLIGGALAARAIRRSPLGILDALMPAALLGGATARCEVLFRVPSVAASEAAWAAGDITVQAGLALGWILLERQRGDRLPPGLALATLLAAHGIARFALEFFRQDTLLYGGMSWGGAMSAVQVIVGAALFALGTSPLSSARQR